MVTTGRGVAGLGSWKGRCSESEKGGVRTRKERERRTSRVENMEREMRAWFESISGVWEERFVVLWNQGFWAGCRGGGREGEVTI